MNLLKRLDAPRATREQLCRVHSPVYLDEIEHRAPKSGLITLDADTVMGPESREAASRAAGAMVQGVDMIMDSHHIVHAPLDAGAYSDEFQQPVQDHLIPALHRFRPELILVSAGFDSHFEDAMGQLNLLDSDYYWITRKIMEVAAQHAEGHVVSTLEGGYELHALGRAVVQHIRALMRI